MFHWNLVIFLMLFVAASKCEDLIYSVEEGKKADTYLGNIALDMNFVKNGESQGRNLKYFQLKPAHSTGQQQLFKVGESTGEFYTARVIDAESVCRQGGECFQMTDVIVQDGETLLKIVKIKIIIEDINDNKPIFPSESIQLYFSEGRSSIRKSIPNAVDRDITVKNSKISYHLQSNRNEPFSLTVTERIDGTSVININVNEKLDREVKSIYHLQVIARDSGQPSLQTLIYVNISVTDINDNSPVFTQSIYNVTIQNELNKQLPLITVSATDKDKDENGKVYYRFSPRTSEISLSHFHLNETSGEIFLRRIFTSSEKPMYVLFVEAYDGANPPLSTLGKVQVNIKYTANNAPDIRINFVSSIAPNTAIVSEGTSEGSFIAYVQVFDHDVGNNGEVSCDLRHEYFQLQSLGATDYKVIIYKKIDRESKDNFNVTITCQDKGNPALFSNNSFLIEISDVNDNPPLFEKSSYTTSFFENNPIGLSIAKVFAYDKDRGENARIVYFLKSDVPFSIGKLSGIIRTKISLDREDSPSLTFPVYAKDHGNPSLTGSTTLTVTVLDVNDKAPEFSQRSFQFSTYENQQPNFPVGFINATDADQGINSELTYSLIRNKGNFIPFQITNDGFLSVVQVLDRELQAEYRFRVLVKDKGIPSLNNSVEVRIKVVDENDNTPEFIFPSGNNFSMTVHYQRFANKEISVVQAHDNDAGKNAILRYKIVGGNEKKLFDIDKIRGSIYFARPATIQDSGLYRLQLVVVDSGIPPNSAESNLSLSVIVNNDTLILNEENRSGMGELVQQNLLIVIVLTVITVAVAFIVITTICVIRRNDIRNSTTNTSLTNNGDPSRTISKQFAFSSDPSLMVANGNGRQNRCGFNYPVVSEDLSLGCNNSVAEKSNPSSGVNKAQATFQNILAAKNRTVQDCVSDISTGSSNNDSGRGWSDADTGTVQELQSMAENRSSSSASQCTVPLLKYPPKNNVPSKMSSQTPIENNFKPNLRSSSFKPNISLQRSAMNYPSVKHQSLPMNSKLQQGNSFQIAPYSTISSRKTQCPTQYSLVAIPITTTPYKPRTLLLSSSSSSVAASKDPMVNNGANLSQAAAGVGGVGGVGGGVGSVGSVGGGVVEATGSVYENESSSSSSSASSSSDSCHLLEDMRKHLASGQNSHFILKDVIV
ncbi:protocadherin alpha-11-like isoform X1 [Argonauta hians]